MRHTIRVSDPEITRGTSHTWINGGTSRHPAQRPGRVDDDTSWYLVSSADRVIAPAAERFFAQRMGAHTAEVDASHASLVSQPATVAAFIEKASR